ncbi:dihydrodipicolinate synthase family protein [Tropicimonas sp. IMCC34011]|uniref:dihydrodipicolinate synthase family protein n=1 Tax=Tropicimonas sp. IMCC34011 TaxID=2248759 RepID=UPI001300A14D|nr:dihydrodipicolinate synthase family protein [Tropicimonas sp. IMCC34011]
MNATFQSGLIPAIVMPFQTDGSIDWQTYDTYIAGIADTGPEGIAVNMAAAEVTSMTWDEMAEAVERARRVADGTKIIAGISQPNTAAAVDLARRMEDKGAEGLVVFPPLPIFMSKPLPASMVTDFHGAINDVVDLPLIAFQTANAAYPPGAIKALADIDGIVAIKDAAFDIERTAEILEEVEDVRDDFAVLTGNDTFILEALLLGCRGALIGFGATATAELSRMVTLANDGKATEAYEIWNALGPLARFVWSNPLRDYRARMKYVLHRQGVFPELTCRAPQVSVSDADRAAIDRIMDRHGLSDTRYLPSGKGQ